MSSPLLLLLRNEVAKARRRKLPFFGLFAIVLLSLLIYAVADQLSGGNSANGWGYTAFSMQLLFNDIGLIFIIVFSAMLVSEETGSGTIRAAGHLLESVNRNAAYMFQNDALLPWKTALENIMFGPLLRGTPKIQAAKDANLWLERVGLRGLAGRYPAQLSGGQRKRVAMAQALINRPPILLMDESFSSLDAQTRALMENELLELWQELRATVLFVTHDLEEAIAMADRLLIFTAGPNATIKGDYPVRLPRPRNVAEVRFAPGFAELYETLWHDLKEEVMASYAR